MQPSQLPSNHHQGRAIPSLVFPTKSNNIMNKRTITHIFVHCTATLPTASVLTSSLRTPRNINLTIFLGKNAKNRAFLV